MGGYILYGFDADGRLAEREELPAQPLAVAKRLAERRLRRYARVELWDGCLCAARLSRPADARRRSWRQAAGAWRASL